MSSCFRLGMVYRIMFIGWLWNGYSLFVWWFPKSALKTGSILIGFYKIMSSYPKLDSWSGEAIQRIHGCKGENIVLDWNIFLEISPLWMGRPFHCQVRGTQHNRTVTYVLKFEVSILCATAESIRKRHRSTFLAWIPTSCCWRPKMWAWGWVHLRYHRGMHVYNC